jgi:hypothetical protein
MRIQSLLGKRVLEIFPAKYISDCEKKILGASEDNLSKQIPRFFKNFE